MKFTTFLKNKIWFILLHLFVVIFITILLSLLRMNFYLIFFISFLIAFTDIVIFLIEYIPKRSFYSKLEKTLEKLDKKYFIHEFLKKPNFEEGIILYDVIYEAVKSMNDEIAKYKISQKEYKEYIETWIHEIKIPISCIELICENSGNNSDNINEITTSISEETIKINCFVEQALFYARSTALEKDYVIRQINLDRTIKKVVKSYSRQLIECKTQLEFKNLDKEVFSDSKWIEFILGQIISNSIKYKEDSLQISFDAKENNNNIVLFITDNGIGIPQKDLKRVCDKGFTGDNGRQYSKSTGIGLYLCKSLCSKMNLNFDITSEKDKGTTVKIIFPKDKSILFES